jgi:hypothetical protein
MKNGSDQDGVVLTLEKSGAGKFAWEGGDLRCLSQAIDRQYYQRNQTRTNALNHHQIHQYFQCLSISPYRS